MAVTKSKFITAAAVADYNQSHYIELPKFQNLMVDLLNRNVTIRNRITPVMATGYPSRYWEQTKIAHNAKFVNPRTGDNGKYGVDTYDEDYGRVEKAVYLKAITSGIKYSLFDTEVVAQQGDALAKSLLNKDMEDMIVDLLQTSNKGIWTGAATAVDDSTSVEYCGLVTQITDAVTVANPYSFATGTGEFVTDTIRTKMASNLASTKYIGMPTAIYANPLTIDYLSRAELKRPGFAVNQSADKMDLGNGFVVNTIRTQAGYLPLIPDNYIPFDPSNKKHTLYVVNEKLIERHYLTNAEPRIFKMGLTKGLLDEYVAVMFDAIVAKGASAGAHFKVEFTEA